MNATERPTAKKDSLGETNKEYENRQYFAETYKANTVILGIQDIARERPRVGRHTEVDI